VHGWVILDKPEGVPSTKAVNIIRRVFSAAKAGHSGTLDPLASGLLPIALGEATKTIPHVMDASKDYDFTIAWGAETETDDREGKVTVKSDIRPKTLEIKAILPQFTGRIRQTPPLYSAIKFGGRRAYDMARNNEVVDMPPREVDIHKLELISNTATEASFTAATGKGAYIRSLGRDLARQLGSAAHIIHLRRKRVGPFRLDMSISLDFFEKIDNSAVAFQALHPVMTALADIPAFAISEHDATRLRCGQKIEAPHAGDVAVALHNGGPVAIVYVDKGEASPKRVFNLPT
jgi:tRNA pseudouridine55 synthase